MKKYIGILVVFANVAFAQSPISTRQLKADSINSLTGHGITFQDTLKPRVELDTMYSKSVANVAGSSPIVVTGGKHKTVSADTTTAGTGLVTKNQLEVKSDTAHTHPISDVAGLTDSLGNHRTYMEANRDSIGIHRTAIDAHMDSIGIHRTAIDAHTDSLAAHRILLNAHKDSLAQHRTELNNHLDSLLNRYTKVETQTLLGDSLSEIRDTLGIYRGELDTHADSIAALRSSIEAGIFDTTTIYQRLGERVLYSDTTTNLYYVPLDSSIQNFVDKVPSGGTLILASGKYTITSPITISKQLNIIGQGNAGFATVPVTPSHGTLISSSTSLPTGAFRITSDNVRIAHLSIDLTGASSVGINVGEDAVTTDLKGVVLHNIDIIVICTGYAQGFTIYGSDAVLRDLTFYVTSTNNAASGLWFWNDSYATRSTTVDCFNVTGTVKGGGSSYAYAFVCENVNDPDTVTLNLSNSVCKSLSGTPLDVAMVSTSTTTNNAIVNAYFCTFDGADYDGYQTGSNQLNLGGSVMANNKLFGTVTYRATMVSNNITGNVITALDTLKVGSAVVRSMAFSDSLGWVAKRDSSEMPGYITRTQFAADTTYKATLIDTLAQHTLDSLLVYRTELDLHGDTLISHDSRISAAIQRALDSTSTHRGILDAHTDSVAQHRAYMEVNRDSLISHDSRISAAIQLSLDSIFVHRGILDAHTDSINALRTDIGSGTGAWTRTGGTLSPTTTTDSVSVFNKVSITKAVVGSTFDALTLENSSGNANSDIRLTLQGTQGTTKNRLLSLWFMPNINEANGWYSGWDGTNSRYVMGELTSTFVPYPPWYVGTVAAPLFIVNSNGRVWNKSLRLGASDTSPYAIIDSNKVIGNYLASTVGGTNYYAKNDTLGLSKADSTTMPGYITRTQFATDTTYKAALIAANMQQTLDSLANHITAIQALLDSVIAHNTRLNNIGTFKWNVTGETQQTDSLRFIAGTNITITQVGNTVLFDCTGGGGTLSMFEIDMDGKLTPKLSSDVGGLFEIDGDGRLTPIVAVSTDTYFEIDVDGKITPI